MIKYLRDKIILTVLQLFSCIHILQISFQMINAI